MGGRIVVRVVSGPDAGLTRAIAARCEVGRGAGADLLLTDPSVSRRHAIVEPREGGLVVVDTGSAAGTRVNGKRVTTTVLAPAASLVKLGDSVLLVLEQRLAHHRGGGFVVVPGEADGGRPVPLVGELMVGRDRTSDLCVDHSSVSRRHVMLRVSAGEVLVTDLDSANGTWINGQPLRGERRVLPGDGIRVGSAPAVLTVRATGSGGIAPHHLVVRSETSATGCAVVVAAPPDATVRAVVAEMARYLGLRAGAQTTWGAYVASSGVLLTGSDRWVDLPLPRGEVLTVAAFVNGEVDGAVSAEAAEAHLEAGGDEEPRAGHALRTAPAGRALPPPVAWADHPDPTVNTPPRATAPPAPRELRAPLLPEGTELKGRGLLWQVAGGGVAVIAAAVVAIRFPQAMLFAVVAAVAGLATVAFGVVGDQSRRRHGVRRFETDLARLDADLAKCAASQADTWRLLSPDRDSMRAWVRERGPRLWERRPSDTDFLRLRLGTGRREVASTVTDTSEDRHGPYAARLADCVARHRTVDDVPVATPAGGVVGVAGPRVLVSGLASHAVVEAAVLHAPSALQVVVVSASPEWRWVRWLPHVSSAAVRLLASSGAAAEIEAAVRTALAAQSAQGQPARVLLVLGQGSASNAAAVAAMGEVRAAGGLVLVLDDEARGLPPECELVCRVDADGRVTAEGPWTDGAVGAFQACSMSPAIATALAVELGRLRDPRLRGDDHAGDQGVLTLSGAMDGPQGPALEALWEAPARLESVFGADDQGQPVTVDLRRDGPHGVIAGTTGSGKSELLLSFLGSLVARHPPERLVLFLIDFKGGATFAPLRELPHVVGYVTDLDGSARLSERAFTALDAEISRRKRILSQHSVADLAAYERLRHAEPLPSLLVVIDEFALLVTEQPGVKARLDAVAAQGRSLGIHLLLATQSPGGVITPAIRANTNIWLCLRVVSDAESLELLGAKDASQIPTEAPGRAFLRRGAERSLSSFQTARITRPLAGSEEAVSVQAYGEPQPARTERRERADGSLSETELDALVAAAQDLHHRRGSPEPFALWVPPLPADLDPTGLDATNAQGIEADTSDGDRAAIERAEADGVGLVVRLGLVDEPHLQRQRPWVLDLALTNLLVSGVFRSGRTTTVRRVISCLTAAHGPDRLHLYVIDARGALGGVEVLPHTGGYAGVHDRELLVSVFDRLTAAVERRRETGFDPRRDARVLLVVDDYSALREVSQTLLQDRVNDQLLSLVAQGRSVGVHVVMTCGQVSDLRLTFASQFQSKLLLRQPEPADYVAVDVRIGAAEMPADLPGRGMVRGGLEVQVAHAQDLPTFPADLAGGPSPVRRLAPEHRARADEGRRGWPAGCIPLGIGGDDGSTVWLGPRHGPHLLVLGESLTGRTTALHTVATRLLEEDSDRRVAVLARRRATLERWADDPRLLVVASPADGLDALLEVVEKSDHPVVLVMDDAEGLALPGMTGDRLDALLRGARDTGLRSVVGARTADWARLFDPWARYLTSLRVALLLAPTPESGLTLEVRLPATVVPMAPGRGFLIAPGQADLVQVSVLTAAPQPTIPAS